MAPAALTRRLRTALALLAAGLGAAPSAGTREAIVHFDITQANWYDFLNDTLTVDDHMAMSKTFAKLVLAQQFNATLEDNHGVVVSFLDQQGLPLVTGKDKRRFRAQQFPLKVRIVLPHLRFKNSAPHSVLVYQDCDESYVIEAGGEALIPTLNQAVTVFDAMVSVPQPYFIAAYTPETNCSAPCPDCFYVSVTPGGGSGHFGADAGYGAALLAGFVSGFHKQDLKSVHSAVPRPYHGISGVHIAANASERPLYEPGSVSICTVPEDSCQDKEERQKKDWLERCSCLWDINKARVRAYMELAVEVLPVAGAERQRRRQQQLLTQTRDIMAGISAVAGAPARALPATPRDTSRLGVAATALALLAGLGALAAARALARPCRADGALGVCLEDGEPERELVPDPSRAPGRRAAE